MPYIKSARSSIGRRLYVIAGLALAALALIATVSVYFASLTGRAAQVVYERSLVAVVEAAELELLIEKHRRIVEAAPLEFDRSQIRKDKRTAEDLRLRIERIVSTSGRDLSERIRKPFAIVVNESREVLALANDFAQQKALEAVERYSAAAETMLQQVREHRGERIATADQEMVALARNGRHLMQWVIGIAALSVLCIAPLSLILIRGIALRLAAITQAMAKLARNETSVAIAGVSDRDEIGEMARAVEVFKKNAITLLTQKSHLEKLNVWLDVALNNMARGLSMFDANECLVLCNANYARMYALPETLTRPGASLDAILERRRPLLKSPGQDGDMPFETRLRRQLASSAESCITQTLADGRIIEITVRPLQGGGWVAVHEDVTENRKTAANIVRLAHHDSLTGLGNRLLFRQELDAASRAAAEADGKPFALLCIDLDKFKEVNDTHGHPMGDALLKSVAERLKATVRSGDVVARLGGDEFAIIQRHIGKDDDARILAERIIASVSAPYQLHGNRIEIGATVGIALSRDGSVESDELLRNADIALYRGKEDQRGTVKFYDSAMEGRLRARRALETDLQQALRDKQFELFYQPIVHLDDGKVSTCEALIRWRHPTRGLVSPAEFIPVAEETGLILGIGAFALQAACAAAVTWPDGVKVAVNISASQLSEHDLFAVTSTALLKSGLDPRRLEIEVTESVLLDDDPSVIQHLHRLRDLGVRIALDDFGTGYSSLSYLRSFPFDKIKIDQTFVRDLSQRQDCVAIVGAVAQLARSLNMVTVAEGVETIDHLSKVEAAGCTEVQGYLFSRPVPAADIARVIADCNGRLAATRSQGRLQRSLGPEPARLAR